MFVEWCFREKRGKSHAFKKNGVKQQADAPTQKRRILLLNADKGLKEGLRFGAGTKTLLELCERGFQM